ncbi:MAG: hypothetical protein Q7S27_01840 [Nanoarchaeota archaeon]|nr:hypothetical protein [Nanoarchaeota archaeon]
MIDISGQEARLLAIGNLLSKKIQVYAIGGTALMLRGIKNSTLDIDLVFDRINDRIEFMSVLLKLGAKEGDVTLVYGLNKNTPLMLNFDNCRFDMFMNKIVTSTFSDSMKERANQTHEFGNLIIKVADPNDILIMKSATSREKDSEDIVSIINKGQINWDIIVEESKIQVKLGNERAIMNLGEKLETLSNRKLIALPPHLLNQIWKLFGKQIKNNSKK